MATINLYFQVHQPYRLAEFTFFDIGSNTNYFNNDLNAEIIHKVAKNCYLPTNTLLLELINKYKNQFKLTFSFSGVFLEQLEQYAPSVLASFQELIKTNCVEILAETYYHSLASVYDETEFKFQVKKHSELIKKLFNYTPTVFRNTELITHPELISFIENLSFETILAEGTPKILKKNKPNQLFPIKNNSLKLLCRNFELSDEIAYRFSDKNQPHYPLNANKFNNLLKAEDHLVPLFMDYETFGEHHAKETGIFTFFEDWINKSIQNNLNTFEIISSIQLKNPKIELSINSVSSWADSEKDISAWAGNEMQKDALQQIYNLKNEIFKTENENLIENWRKLQTSDHFYYMSTKHLSDGEVHSYFSPFRSPYDAYLFYTNIIKDIRLKLLNSKL